MEEVDYSIFDIVATPPKTLLGNGEVCITFSRAEPYWARKTSIAEKNNGRYVEGKYRGTTKKRVPLKALVLAPARMLSKNLCAHARGNA